VIGVPMDFRLGFGGVFGAHTKLIVADRAEPDRPHPRDVAAGLYGNLSGILSALAGATAGEHQGWIGDLRAVESAASRGAGPCRALPDVARDGSRRLHFHAPRPARESASWTSRAWRRR